MSTQSKIEWTDATWNPVRGCTKVSPGCAHCYAETFAERWRGTKGHPYEQGFDLRLVPEKLTEPLHWRKPRRVFVNSMSDLFHEGVPFEFIDKVFAVMALTPQHTYQVLTKRPERMAEYLRDGRDARVLCELTVPEGCRLGQYYEGPIPWPLPNVWLGTSVEDQKRADERIPHLLRCPAAIRFLSCEPLLGLIDLDQFVFDRNADIRKLTHGPMVCNRDQADAVVAHPVDWVIVGGESGPKARPCDIAWIRSIVEQCRSAGVPCFVKQLGAKITVRNDSASEWPRDGDEWIFDDRISSQYQGEPMTIWLNDRKGGDPSEWPEDLRVREFPECNQ